MSYNSYAYLVLIDQKSNLSLTRLEERLLSHYQKDKRVVEIHQKENQVHLNIDQFTFTITLNQELIVL